MAINFENKEVRTIKCLPLKSALKVDQNSKNKTIWLSKYAKKVMVYEFQAILSL